MRQCYCRLVLLSCHSASGCTVQFDVVDDFCCCHACATAMELLYWICNYLWSKMFFHLIWQQYSRPIWTTAVDNLMTVLNLWLYCSLIFEVGLFICVYIFTYGHDSVLSWQCKLCNTLCTSSCMDDVMCLCWHNAAYERE